MTSLIHALARRGTAALAPVVFLGALPLVLAPLRGPIALRLPRWSFAGPAYQPHGSPVSSSPMVSLVSPDHSPNSGGSVVVITGSSFAGATQVLFGPNAVSFTVDSDSQITASLGNVSTTGWVDVSVTNPCGTGTLVHAFDYFQPPTRHGFGACYALDWFGSPTLGQSYTITFNPPAPGIIRLGVRWSLGGSNKPGVSYFRPNYTGCGTYLFRPTNVLSLVGSPPSHTFVIPDDVSLIGAHLQAQVEYRVAMSGPHYHLSPMLDAVIGE